MSDQPNSGAPVSANAPTKAEQRAASRGYDRAGDCGCFWAAKFYGDVCPEHGKSGKPIRTYQQVLLDAEARVRHWQAEAARLSASLETEFRLHNAASAELVRRAAALEAELDACRQRCVGLAERCAAQSELLSRKAERRYPTSAEVEHLQDQLAKYPIERLPAVAAVRANANDTTWTEREGGAA